MARKDALSAWAEGDDIKDFRALPRNFHPWRAHRHSRDRKSAHAARLLGKDALHVGYRDMTLKYYPVHNRCMAG